MITINSYMVAFPGVSIASRAKSLLQSEGYAVDIGRSQPGLLKSCAYAVYFDTDNIQRALRILSKNGVMYSGLLIKNAGKYIKIG